jgi:hypothetical protein
VPFGSFDETATRPLSWASKLLITLKPKARSRLVHIEIRRQSHTLIRYHGGKLQLAR